MLKSGRKGENMKKYLIFLVVIATMVSACSQTPQEPASLTGTTWKLTTFGRVDSPAAAVADSEGTITFATDGKVEGVGACNEFHGEYEVKGDQITIGLLSWGSENCPEPKMTQESTFYDVLSFQTVDFKIVGNTLTIKRMTLMRGELVLVFEAVSGE
jgi:heat shock protein HslJ